MMKTTYFLNFVICFSIFVAYANEPPLITNFKWTIDECNNKLMIDFDLSDKEDDQLEISLSIMNEKREVVYILTKNNCNGDIGFPVLTGKNKKIIWTYDRTIFSPKNHILKLIADDKYKIELTQLMQEVDTIRMMKDLDYILGERNNSNWKTKRHLRRVGKYIKNSFKDNGLKSYLHKLEISNSEINELWDAQTGFGKVIPQGEVQHEIKNIIGSIQGEIDENKVIILSAHYDSYPGSKGMDDNASGIIGLLEVMRVLSKFKYGYTIKFIGFDKEEDGLLGSLSYILGGGIKERERIEGVINFDMIGVYSNRPGSQIVPEGFDMMYPEVCAQISKNKYRGDFVINTSNVNSQKLSSMFVTTANTYVDGLKIISLIAEENGKYAPSLAASDHASFWYNDIPALHIGEGGATRNPYLHTIKDSENYIDFNYKFMSEIVKATIGTLYKLAEIGHFTVVSARLNN